MKTENWVAFILMCLAFLSAGCSENIALVRDAQESDAVTWLRLNSKAHDLYRKNRYLEGLAVAKQELAFSVEAFGSEHSYTATSLHNLAAFHVAMGAYSEAEPLYKRAHSIREKNLGPEHRNSISTLTALASLYREMGAYDQAERLSLQALAIREEALGTDHVDLVTNLNNLAVIHVAKGTYRKAQSLLERALAIEKKARDSKYPGSATILSNLAECLRLTGAYEQAESLLVQALAANEEVYGPSHFETTTVLNNLAVLYNSMGAYDQAELLYARVLARTEEALGSEHLDTAISLSNLASLLQDTGAYDRAEPLLVRALAITKKTFGDQHHYTASALHKLGQLYYLMGAYSKAQSLLQRALTIREKTVGREHPETAANLNDLGVLYTSTGAFAKAEQVIRESFAIAEKTLGSEHPGTATVLESLAVMHHSMGAYDEAESLVKRVLDIDEKTLGSEHPDMAITLYNAAILAWAQADWGLALDRFRQAAQIHAANSRRILALGDESRKRAYAETLVFETNSIVTFSLASRNNVPKAESLGVEVILQRKGQVLDVLAGTMESIRKSLAPEDQELFSRWQEIASQYASAVFHRPKTISAGQYKNNISQLNAQMDSLQGELSIRNNQFRQQLAPVTLRGVQRVIPDEAVLIEWFRYRPRNPNAGEKEGRWGEPRYMAYVLKNRGEPVAVDIGEADPIEKAIADLLVALAEQHGTVAEIGRELDERLMQPLRPYLGGAKRLLISPDGQLNLLPFGVLTDDRGRYLLQVAEISYLTSGRDLLRLTDGIASRQGAIVVANPEYGPLLPAVANGNTGLATNRRSADMRDGVLRDFEPLKGVAQEAMAVKSVLGLNDEQVLTGVNASEAAIKQLKGPRILHLATHGFFLEAQPVYLRDTVQDLGADGARPIRRENPLVRSGLALAGANQLRSGNEDGILTALEVAGLDLAGTRLAVLSACETGLGQVQNGEGVYGLRRALVLAGVESQVVSLWKVSDTATRALMVDFYTRLAKGRRPSQALHEAQLTMMKDPSRAHPFYWAAFVAIGGSGPLGD
jgi:CHAT domain-containing protein/tetratricopeptide (TPR) repeat protein